MREVDFFAGFAALVPGCHDFREAAGPANLDDLPLFAAVAEAAPSYGPSPAEEALRVMDPDGMSPREAMDALYRLKGLMGG